MTRLLLHDVGLRDGLQIEQHVVPTDRKLQWIDRLVTTGIDLIQVGSFVNPQKVPQMADTDALFARLRQHPARNAGVAFTGLVLNEKGLERGLACDVGYFCMGVSASDTHSRKNTGMTTADATTRIIAMGRQALAAGARVQVSVQSAFGCGFEGPVPAGRVLDIAQQFIDAGLTTVSLADTAGHADPAQVEALFGALLSRGPGVSAACHFHDTYGLGLANVYAAWRAGVTSFECAFGGLGGCPFTAVAAGNVCTEDVVHLFHRMGLRTDVTTAPLLELVKDVETLVGRTLPGTIHQTGPIPHAGRLDSAGAPGARA
ncbi:MAG: hydroxymethylglutaryl-CoA lyase [Vicinamibacterales bacterium]|nr:hydroxymethylglutaryl-CoA lyase [Vicinamibacterales bacterium]